MENTAPVSDTLTTLTAAQVHRAIAMADEIVVTHPSGVPQKVLATFPDIDLEDPDSISFELEGDVLVDLSEMEGATANLSSNHIQLQDGRVISLISKVPIPVRKLIGK